MKRTTLILVSLAILASMLVTSCTTPAAPPAPQPAQATAVQAPAAPAATEAPAAAAPAPAASKGTKYYWLQPVKGHPVHQLTQAAFLTSCKAEGMECEVVGPDDADTNKLIAAAEQVLAKGDAAGVSFWTGSPAYLDVIKKFEAAGIPVAAPHFMVPEGTWPANTFTMGTDPSAYAAAAAVEICKQVGKDKAGTVALTQGSFNTTENLVSESFTAKMATECPSLKVLKAEEEGFDPPKAIAKAVAIMQANPDIVAALSTTGGGPTTWAGAQKETGKKIIAIGMDYTKVNLDLVKAGEMYAVVGQPLWDESFQAAAMLKKAAAGEKQPYWTPMEAPIITAAEVDKYYKMLADAEAMFAAPAGAKPTGTKYYWLQPVKGHPVHQLTQAAFLTSCKAEGMECEVVGPDDADTNKLIAAAEQVLAKGDAAGVSFWTGSPAYLDVIKKFEAAGIPVAAPHFMVPEGTWPANTFTMGTDPSAYAAAAAVEICKQVGKDKAGTVALTQGSFNTTENLVSESFTAKMATECPSLKVLKPEEEGFDPPKAIAKAVAIMQANPDVVAALSTTGGGPTTWAGAQKETGKKIIAIGMDYTKVNLDLVKAGEMYAVVGQPLWDESFQAAAMLKKAAAGEKQPYWTPMEAPIITAAEVDKYYKMLADAEAMFAAPAGAKPTGTKYYWLQPVKGHPVHQLTQAAFLTSCKAEGMECEVVGPDDADTNKLIAAAEQVLAKGDAAGVSFWTGSPAYLDVIKKFDAAGIPVAAPHFMVPEGTWPANTFTMGTDPSAYAAAAAVEICKQVGKDKKGTVALTQGSFNTTENLVSESFTAKMATECPSLKVLKPEEEGFDPPKAIAKAVAIMQANPDVVAALSTTGGGPTTWAGAQKETGKKIIAIGMDYTKVNLDLVKAGEMYAVVGQPLWDESFQAAAMLKKAAAGEKQPYWTPMEAPIITAADVDKYYKMLADAEAMFKK